jgi:hypothetical protein
MSCMNVILYTKEVWSQAVDLQVPALNIFESNLRRGKFDASRKLSDGSLMEFVKVYPMDAVYDSPEDVPEEVQLTAL